jgi:hypothetical protein
VIYNWETPLSENRMAVSVNCAGQVGFPDRRVKKQKRKKQQGSHFKVLIGLKKKGLPYHTDSGGLGFPAVWKTGPLQSSVWLRGP